jgi:hypothetical protein
MKKTLYAFTWFILMAAIVSLTNFAAASPNPTPTAYPLPTHPVIFMTPDETTPVYPDLGPVVDETDHFQFHEEQGYMPVNLDTFKVEAETIFEEMQAQIPVELDKPIILAFRRPPNDECPHRGEAYPMPDGNVIIIFASPTTSPIQLRGVLAHEIVHILHSASTGLSTTAFSEGYATWISREYWAAWMGYSSVEDAVRAYLDAGTYLPLYTHFEDFSLAYEGENCLFYRDILYTEWASFVGYLIEMYGLDSFVELMEYNNTLYTFSTPAAAATTSTPNFEGIYGQSLNQLEAAWLRQITGES